MEREAVVIVVTTSEPGSAAGEAPEKMVECSEVGVDEKKVDKFSCVIDVKEMRKEEDEKVCRICHLNSDQPEFQTTLIQLGCGCKGELGTAHLHCGETWFKLKGNRTCEICGEAAKNITGLVEEMNNGFIEEWNESSTIQAIPETSRAGGCWRGQSFCNFLMACLVIAFVLPWFFRISMFR